VRDAGRQDDVHQRAAPGRRHTAADLADPSKYTSQWPSNVGYGAGKRPRSATVVITKNNGQRVGT
jgi:uncharacterized protein